MKFSINNFLSKMTSSLETFTPLAQLIFLKKLNYFYSTVNSNCRLKNSKFKLNFITTFVTILTTSTCSFAATETKPDFSDWVIDEKSSSNEYSNLLCKGCYKEPSYPFPLKERKEYPTNITSDEGEFISKGDSTFSGNVVATQGNRTIYTDQAIITHNATSGELETLQAIGKFKLTEPGIRIDGEQAKVFYNQNKKIIEGANYRIYKKHAHGCAKRITIYNDTKMELPNSSYTTCAPGENTWQLKAKETKFNLETGRGEAWHSTLYVKDVPVFYWPYVNFPIDDRRQTGFLFPYFSSSSSHGATIVAPYYLNLAPNYDATITPHFMTKRRLKLDNDFRYLTTNNYGKIQFNFLPADREYRSFIRNKTSNPGNVAVTEQRYRGLRENKFRYGFAISHHSEFTKNLLLDLEYSRVSDDNYLYNFFNDLSAERVVDPTKASFTNTKYILGMNDQDSALAQKATLTYRTEIGTFTTRLNQYQSLHPFLGAGSDEALRSLPEVDFASNETVLPYNFKAKINTNYTQFRIRQIPFVDTRTTGNRLHVKPEISLPIISDGWFFKPRVQYNIVSYDDLKLSKADKNANKPTKATRSIPIYDLDTGLIFERNLKLNKENYLQTLEPRIYYLYVPNKKQNHLPDFDNGPADFNYNQIFRDNRYNGRDRVGDTSQVSLGVFNRLLTKDSGEEKANFGIGRILYLKNRTKHHIDELYSTTDRWSPLAMTANYQLHPHWLVTANVVRERFNRSGPTTLTAQYKPSDAQVVNFGYQFGRSTDFNKEIKQYLHLKTINISAAWELNPSLRLLGRYDYDLNLKRNNEILAGFEMHSCCTITKVALVKKRRTTTSLLNKEYENMLMLQLIFKGLAGAGSLNKGYLQSAIPGY